MPVPHPKTGAICHHENGKEEEEESSVSFHLPFKTVQSFLPLLLLVELSQWWHQKWFLCMVRSSINVPFDSYVRVAWDIHGPAPRQSRWSLKGELMSLQYLIVITWAPGGSSASCDTWFERAAYTYRSYGVSTSRWNLSRCRV